jgi:hypothetical protein
VSGDLLASVSLSLILILFLTLECTNIFEKDRQCARGVAIALLLELKAVAGSADIYMAIIWIH